MLTIIIIHSSCCVDNNFNNIYIPIDNIPAVNVQIVHQYPNITIFPKIISTFLISIPVVPKQYGINCSINLSIKNLFSFLRFFLLILNIYIKLILIYFSIADLHRRVFSFHFFDVRHSLKPVIPDLSRDKPCCHSRTGVNIPLPGFLQTDMDSFLLNFILADGLITSIGVL